MTDFKKVIPYKGKAKMQDPPRFPKIIVPLENKFKDSYSIGLNKMVVDLTKKMVEFKK